MIRPGPKEGPRSFTAVPPAPGSDLGGRPPRPKLAILEPNAAPAPNAASASPAAPVAGAALPAGVDFTKYGKWPSMGDPNGPKPNYVPGQGNYNPFERRWID